MAAPNDKEKAEEVRRLFADLAALYARMAEASSQSTFGAAQSQIPEDRKNASALISRIREIQKL